MPKNDKKLETVSGIVWRIFLVLVAILVFYSFFTNTAIFMITLVPGLVISALQFHFWQEHIKEKFELREYFIRFIPTVLAIALFLFLFKSNIFLFLIGIGVMHFFIGISLIVDKLVISKY